MSAKLGAVSVGHDLTDRSAVSNALAAAVDQEVTGNLHEVAPLIQQRPEASDRQAVVGLDMSAFPARTCVGAGSEAC